jgi:pilus assembly protein FimV
MGNNNTFLKLTALVCLGFFTINGYALALTEAELKSHLNQQLDVRIGLLTDQAAELDDLKISLTYIAENNVARYKLKYELIKSDEGNYLKITTHDVIREPIIEFTVDIGWSDGHVVREYSFLIDPSRN